jgi:hypothetical protein
LRQIGQITETSYRRNPEAWDTKTTLAARIFVGFNVGDTPTYKLDDLVKVTSKIRLEQGKPNASFLAQKGIYQHKDGTGIVTEDSGQIIIIDVWSTPKKAFRAEMIELAETIARRMHQEEVVVELQKNGVTQETIGVTA